MSFYAHTAITLGYLALAAGVTLGLYRTLPAINQPLALVLGGITVLVGVLLHQTYARYRRDRGLSEELADIRTANEEVMDELESSREEFKRLASSVEEVAKRPTYDEGKVLAEMRMLETLLKQLSQKRGRATPISALARASAGLKRARKREGEAPRPPSSSPRLLANVNGAQVLDIIRQAIENSRVDLYLQPVVRLPQRRTRYYEAFSRLRAGDGSIIEPTQYIAVAERAGLIAAIDNSLLFRCVQLVRATRRRGLNFGFFCNISGYTLRDESFFPQFIEFMEHNVELAGSLFFEFTQADFLSHGPGTAANLERLAALGFRFSLDRLTSLDLDSGDLARRYVEFVKIDAQSLLDQLRDPATALLAHRLKLALNGAGISLIVGKVEEEEDLVELLDFPVEFGQGFLFGQPRLSREVR